MMKPKALCFDFGNTLVPFGPRQVAVQYRMLIDRLMAEFGSCDEAKFKAIRDRQIVEPYDNNFRENDMQVISRELLEGLYGIRPSQEQIDMVIETRYHAFVQVVEIAAEVKAMLERLSQRFALGFLSNYPCGRSTRSGLEKLGIRHLFKAITISGEIGLIKPHPRPFRDMLGQLQLVPEECVYVGDNWLADVQGSKRIGMKLVFISQHEAYESFEPEPGDFEPDARIGNILELEALFNE